MPYTMDDFGFISNSQTGALVPSIVELNIGDKIMQSTKQITVEDKKTINTFVIVTTVGG